MSILEDWAQALIPPVDGNPKANMRWRAAISVGMVLFTLHICWACGVLPGFAGFAQAADVDEVKATIGDVQRRLVSFENKTLQVSLETEIRRLDQAIFDIEARVNELRGRKQEVDRFYIDRLLELKSERERTMRRLQIFQRTHPELAEQS